MFKNTTNLHIERCLFTDLGNRELVSVVEAVKNAELKSHYFEHVHAFRSTRFHIGLGVVIEPLEPSFTSLFLLVEIGKIFDAMFETRGQIEIW